MIRNWNRKTDNGAVHVLGNGRMAVYEIGPELIQIVGAPYSADSFGSLSIPSVNSCSSERLPKTAIWRHTLDNGTVMTDVVDSQLTGFVREIDAADDFTMVLKTSERFECCGKEDVVSFYSPAGTTFFIYETPFVMCYSIAVSGAASIVESTEHTYEIHIKKGKSMLIIANEAAVIEQIQKTPSEEILQRTAEYWHEFVGRGRKVPEEVAELCENVAIMIKAQQSEDGGILAGYPYHLAYIRDQYGTVRGLLKMGYIKEAKAVMYYYLSIFKEYGTLHNAQSIGEHGTFHIHENDKVEITGYISIMPFDIYRYSEDRAFMEEMMPMVRWALDCQAGELKKGMLPFNGDETYVAGGFLPRATLYDGSAEATMLFAEGIQRYQEYTGDERYASCLAEIKDNYLMNFCPDGRYITNLPGRISVDEYPPTRHGVCEACGCSVRTVTKTASNRYVCSECLNKEPLPAWESRIYEMAASKLAPVYIGSSLVPDDIVCKYLNEMVENYHQTGQMPAGCPEGECVGYDYGMFLYALTSKAHPAAEEFYELTRKVVDETGAWCEYYHNGIARATRCRPWESGINIEAILTYLEQSH